MGHHQSNDHTRLRDGFIRTGRKGGFVNLAGGSI
jgi:hypothetical protein